LSRKSMVMVPPLWAWQAVRVAAAMGEVMMAMTITMMTTVAAAMDTVEAVAMGKSTQRMGIVIVMVPLLRAWQVARVAAAMRAVIWGMGLVAGMDMVATVPMRKSTKHMGIVNALVPLLRAWRVGMVKAMGRRVSVATPMVVPALVARKKVDDASFQNGMTLR